MDLLFITQSLTHALSALSVDDSSMSVLAMLAGIIGGWTVTGMRQPKARKVKVDRKNDSPRG